MELRDYIREANEIAGTQSALAQILDISSTHIAAAKRGTQGLRLDACYKLAALLQRDPAEIAAANALVTERNEERRKVFYPFVMRKAATIAALSLGLVILEITPIDAEAALRLGLNNGSIVIMSSLIFAIMLIKFKDRLRQIGTKPIKLPAIRTPLA
ncbi:MAG: helix-turn-helix transcriptional regulator [Parvibaculum sp.]|nr:helix-turn-helix transcriptional regulator [Parvibaculum sp.]